MIYTIDVGFLYTDYRLKKDGTFKKFNGGHFKEVEVDDETFVSDSDAKFVASKINTIEVDGETINVRTGQLGSMHIAVRPHRTGKPAKSIFTRDELKQVLLNGNDDSHNSLIIDFDGYPRLVTFNTTRTTPHAVRYESFQAGNGYVGPNSKLNHLERTYLGLLDGWSSHLFCHDTIYVDYTDNFVEQEKLNEINNLIQQL